MRPSEGAAVHYPWNVWAIEACVDTGEGGMLSEVGVIGNRCVMSDHVAGEDAWIAHFVRLSGTLARLLYWCCKDNSLHSIDFRE